MKVAGFVILTVIALMISINIAHAQIDNQRTVLGGDLANDPVAQDILNKIEKSKRDVDKLQKKEFGTIDNQRTVLGGDILDERGETEKWIDETEKWIDGLEKKKFGGIEKQVDNQRTVLGGDLANDPVAQDILNKIEKSKRDVDKLQKKEFGVDKQVKKQVDEQIDEQITNQRTVLGGDLANDPVAQDILNKIEKSKRWIDKLQNKEFKATEKQRELEEKKESILAYLDNDLKKWEAKWEYHSFEKLLERTLEGDPAQFSNSIYDNPLKFTASKVKAGHSAMKKVLQNGGGPIEARDAFADAAKITRVEMVSVNALYNILKGDAYYNQQVLFDEDGKFNLGISGEQLRQYYLDYRTNPGYLASNPNDTSSWEELSESDSETECRDNYILIYRHQAKDYVCVTEYTAEIWIKYEMGSPVRKEIQVIPDELTEIRLNQDRIAKKISGFDLKIKKIHDNYDLQREDIEKKYALIFIEMKGKQHGEEKILSDKINRGEISRESFTTQMTNVRENYSAVEKTSIKEKFRILEIIDNALKEDLEILLSIYEQDSEIRITWDTDKDTYSAVERT